MDVGDFNIQEFETFSFILLFYFLLKRRRLCLSYSEFDRIVMINQLDFNKNYILKIQQN